MHVHTHVRMHANTHTHTHTHQYTYTIGFKVFFLSNITVQIHHLINTHHDNNSKIHTQHVPHGQYVALNGSK